MSPYFEGLLRWRLRKLLATSTVEEVSRRVNELLPICVDLLDQSAEGVWYIVQFAYKQAVDLRFDNVELIIRVVDFFGAAGLLKLCYEFIQQELCIENAVNIWKFSRTGAHKSLENAALRFLLANFQQVMRFSEELRTQLQAHDLDELLASDQLNVRHEEMVFEVVVGWVNEDRSRRSRHLFPLLCRVRFGLLPPGYLREMALVPEQRDLTSDWRVKSWTETAERFLHAVLQRSSPTPPPSTLATGPPAALPVTLPAEPPAEQETGTKMRSRYRSSHIPVDGQLLYSCPLTRPRQAHEAVLATGGWSDAPTQTIELYDCHADLFVDFPYVDPEGPRAYHGAAVLKNHLFIIGGITHIAGTDPHRKHSLMHLP